MAAARGVLVCVLSVVILVLIGVTTALDVLIVGALLVIDMMAAAIRARAAAPTPHSVTGQGLAP